VAYNTLIKEKDAAVGSLQKDIEGKQYYTDVVTKKYQQDLAEARAKIIDLDSKIKETDILIK
jgi:hypothetical protein